MYARNRNGADGVYEDVSSSAFPNPGFRSVVPALLFTLCLSFGALEATARLDEDPAQNAARYGSPSAELIGKDEKPLLEGAKEEAFNHDGWRVRVAYLNGKAARIEYAKIPDAGGAKKLTEPEVQAVLEAEKGNFRWREEKPRTGFAGLNALKTALEGRSWERSDHAVARLKYDLIVTVETRAVEAYEKRSGKAPGRATPSGKQADVPKF